MNIRKLLTGGMATAVLSLSMVGAASAAHNANGSFETGVVILNPPGYVVLSAGDSSSIPNWTVTSGTVDYIGDYWVELDGSRSLDLTGSDGSAGAVSKTFATVVGHTYEVTFDLAGNPDGDPNIYPVIKNLEVDAAGTVDSYTFDTTGKSTTNMGWTQETFAFTATGSSTTLTFTSLDVGFYGPALDNVVITDVLTSKEQCKKDGWKAYSNPSFKNQGDCVSYIQSSHNAVGNRKDN